MPALGKQKDGKAFPDGSCSSMSEGVVITVLLSPAQQAAPEANEKE
jgi:hypothetical protein